MADEDQVVTKFVVEAGELKGELRQIIGLAEKAAASLKGMSTQVRAPFAAAGQAASSMRTQVARTAQSTQSLNDQFKDLNRMTGEFTTSFRRGALALQTGSMAFDKLSLALDRSSMMMWRFSIAAIPLRNIAFQAGMVAAAFGGLAYKMGQAGAWVEITRRQFTALYESQGKTRQEADAMFQWLRKEERTIPATFKEVVEAARILTTQGFDPKTLLRPLSDMTVGINQAGIDIVSATRAVVDATHGEFRRLKNTFNIGREDVMRFGEGLFDAQGRVIDRQKLLAAVVKAIAEKYPKATEAAMGGLALAITNLQGAVFNFFSSVGKIIAPALTKWVDRLAAVADWLARVADHPIWGKVMGWGVMWGTVASALVALGGVVAYVGLQFAGLVASMKVFFSMYSKDMKNTIEMELQLKNVSSTLSQIRAEGLIKELPLLSMRLQLLKAMTDQELAMQAVGMARVRGTGLAEAQATAVAAGERVTYFTGQVQKLTDIYHMPQLEEELRQTQALAQKRAAVAAAARAEEQRASHLLKIEQERRVLTREIGAQKRLIASGEKILAEAELRKPTIAMRRSAKAVRAQAVGEAERAFNRLFDLEGMRVEGIEKTPEGQNVESAISREQRALYRANLQILSTGRQLEKTKANELASEKALKEIDEYRATLADKQNRVEDINAELAGTQLKTKQGVVALDRKALALEEQAVATRNEAAAIETRLKAARAGNVRALETEAAASDKQRATFGQLLALERERTAQRRLGAQMAAGLPTPGARQIPLGLGMTQPSLGARWRWQPSEQMMAGISERAGPSLGARIGGYLLDPLQKARDGLVAFGKYAKQSATALWQGIQPGLRSFGMMALQMLAWAAAFAAADWIYKRWSSSMTRASDKAIELADAASGAAAALGKIASVVPTPPGVAEKVASAGELSSAWAKALEAAAPKGWNIGEITKPKEGLRTLEAELGPLAGPEIQATAKRALDVLRQPGVYVGEGKLVDSEVYQEIEHLSQKTLRAEERRLLTLSNSTIQLLLQVGAEWRAQQAINEKLKAEQDYITYNTRAQVLAGQWAKAAKSEADRARYEELSNSSEAAITITKQLTEQRDAARATIGEFDDQKQKIDDIVKKNDDWGNAAETISATLNAQRNALAEIGKIDATLAWITDPKITAEREQQRKAAEEILRLEYEYVRLKEYQERFRRLGEVVGTVSAAGAQNVRALTEAQIATLQGEMRQAMATGDIKGAWDLYKQQVELRNKQNESDIAAKERSIGLQQDSIDKERQLRDLGLERIAEENRQYEEQRSIIAAQTMRGYLDEPTARLALVDIEEQHQRKLDAIETEREGHRRAAWDKYNEELKNAQQKTQELINKWKEYWDWLRDQWGQWLGLRDTEYELAKQLYDLQMISEQQLENVRRRNMAIQWWWMGQQRNNLQEYYAAYGKYLGLVKDGIKETEGGMQDLIGQVIGAPQEAIRRLISPAAIQQRFAGLIGTMAPGMTATVFGPDRNKITIEVEFPGLMRDMDARAKTVIQNDVLPALTQGLRNALSR